MHTVWEGVFGNRHNLVLGHEGVGEVVEVGFLVHDFKPDDRVIVHALTPDRSSLEAQAGYTMYSDGMFGEFFHVNDADGNLALLPLGMGPRRWLYAQ